MLIDVDGTLLESNDAHARAWQRALREAGYSVGLERLRRMIGMGGDRILARIDPSLDDRSEPGRSIARARQRIFLDEYVWMLPPTRGARALLMHLQAMGVERVVATSAKRNELGALLRTAGVADQIDLAVTSDDAQRSKPDADIVQGALRKSGTQAHEAIYLGDTPYDVEAARRAGVACIALRSGGWNDRELAGAAAVYDDPADLLERFNTSPV